MNARSISVILVCFLILASSVRTEAESNDEYWKKKAEAAYEVAEKSYTPDPFAVANSFNNDVDR